MTKERISMAQACWYTGCKMDTMGLDRGCTPVNVAPYCEKHSR